MDIEIERIVGAENAPVDRNLKRSLEKVGQLVPILVRPATEDRWELLDGRRRVAAARDLGWEEIEAVRPSLELAPTNRHVSTLVTNLVRGDNPITEARAIKALIEDGYAIETLKELGLSKNKISRRLKLLNLDISFQDKLERGEIALSTAARLADLPPEQQAKLKGREKITGADVEQIRREWMLSLIDLESISTPSLGDKAEIDNPRGSVKRLLDYIDSLHLTSEEEIEIARVLLEKHGLKPSEQK